MADERMTAAQHAQKRAKYLTIDGRQVERRRAERYIAGDRHAAH